MRKEFLQRPYVLGAHLARGVAALSDGLRLAVEPYLLMGDPASSGSSSSRARCSSTRGNARVGAVISTPLRFWEYLTAKLRLLVLVHWWWPYAVRCRQAGFDCRRWWSRRCWGRC